MIKQQCGNYRHWVTLKRYTISVDLGQEIKTPTTVGTYWASITQLNGGESASAQQIQAGSTHLIEMRYIGPISEQDYFEHCGNTYQITSVNNVEERNVQYLIMVKKV